MALEARVTDRTNRIEGSNRVDRAATVVDELHRRLTVVEQRTSHARSASPRRLTFLRVWHWLNDRKPPACRHEQQPNRARASLLKSIAAFGVSPYKVIRRDPEYEEGA